MAEQATGLANIFTQSFGQQIGEAIISHDWSGIGEALAGQLTQVIQGAMSSMGPLGGFVGGIFGGVVGGLLGKVFGGGSSSSRRTRGDSMSNPMYTHDVNTQRLLTELLNATKVNMLRTAAEGARGGGGYDASEFQREVGLIGAGA